MESGITPARIDAIKRLVHGLYDRRNSEQIRRARREYAPARLRDFNTLWGIVSELQEYRCPGCNHLLDDCATKLSFEHLFGIRFGHVAENVIVACASCNSSHRRRKFLTWLGRRDLARALSFNTRWKQHHGQSCDVYTWPSLVDSQRAINRVLLQLEPSALDRFYIELSQKLRRGAEIR